MGSELSILTLYFLDRKESKIHEIHEWKVVITFDRMCTFLLVQTVEFEGVTLCLSGSH